MSRNSGIALLVASSLFLLAQSAGGECQGYIVNPQEQHFFEFQEEDHCPSEELFNKLNEEVKRSACRVNSTLLKLNSDPEYTYDPKFVVVQRCIGGCRGTFCRSIRNGARYVQVTRKHIGGNTECGQIEVLDHWECSCG